MKRSYDVDVTNLAPIELCDFFWARLRACYPEKSELELEPFKLKDESCFDNLSFGSSHTIADFPAYIKATVDSSASLSQKSCTTGSPIILVITPSAIRAVSVARGAKEACMNLKVAKLFAKHLKVDEQIDFLNKSDVSLGVGTPNRIIKLVEI
ncbi:Protein cms1, partial [Massospora cicadina]